jgi:hypothetical protein
VLEIVGGRYREDNRGKGSGDSRGTDTIANRGQVRGLLDISLCRLICKLNTQAEGHFINKSILKNMYFYITEIFLYIQFLYKVGQFL